MILDDLLCFVNLLNLQKDEYTGKRYEQFEKASPLGKTF